MLERSGKGIFSHPKYSPPGFVKRPVWEVRYSDVRELSRRGSAARDAREMVGMFMGWVTPPTLQLS